MKKALILFSLTVVLIGCGGAAKPDEFILSKNVVPDSLKPVAAKYLKELMDAASVQSRVDDEDWDDFLKEANKIVTELYGVPTWGIYVNYGVFVPYDLCSPVQQKAINEYLRRER